MRPMASDQIRNVRVAVFAGQGIGQRRPACAIVYSPIEGANRSSRLSGGGRKLKELSVEKFAAKPGRAPKS